MAIPSSSPDRQTANNQDDALAAFLRSEVNATLSSYQAKPSLILEHAAAEGSIQAGGYGHRQLYELIQNGADEIIRNDICGKVEILLTKDCLYCANEGASITESGIRALLQMHLSGKRGNEIGRFGLGFKAVLGVCDRPEFLSKVISFRFNPSELADEMRGLVGHSQELPKMRTVALLDCDAEAERDPHLKAFLSWATTVIKLPLLQDCISSLQNDLEKFPQEFLLFSPHVSKLVLRNESGFERVLAVEVRDNKIYLTEGDTWASWFVFTKNITVGAFSKAAQQDIDNRLRERNELPVKWAVAADNHANHRIRGRFWAFFPTQNDTTLQGILNAPWKTNSDRENLLDGPFNKEMLRYAAELVVGQLSTLNSTEDPVRFLDVLPARDPINWADNELRIYLFITLEKHHCLADREGVLRLPSKVRLLPECAEEFGFQSWLKEYGNLLPPDIAHPRIRGRERRSRAERLGCRILSLNEWISLLLVTPNVESSIAAVRLVGLLLDNKKLVDDDKKMIRAKPCVLTKWNELRVPDDKRLAFLDSSDQQAVPNLDFVHYAVAGDLEAKRVLEQHFKIAVVSPAVAFRAFLEKVDGNSASWELNWDRFWHLSRQLEPEAAAVAIEAKAMPSPIKAKLLNGEFRLLSEILLPGLITLESDGEAVKSILVDVKFHARDRALLERMGAVDRPIVKSEVDDEIYLKYQTKVEERFRKTCMNEGCPNPQNGFLHFVNAKLMGPVDPLRRITGSANVRMTRELIIQLRANREWEMVHRSRPDSYPIVRVPSGLTQVIKMLGWLDTTLGPTPVKDVVGPALSRWSTLLPIARCSGDDASLLKLIQTEDGLSLTHVNDGIRRARTFGGKVEELAAFYSVAARLNVSPPSLIRCKKGGQWIDAAPREITITDNANQAELLQNEVGGVLFASSGADLNDLVKHWRLKRASKPEISFRPASEPERLADLFPATKMTDSVLFDITLQCCKSLYLEGNRSHPM